MKITGVEVLATLERDDDPMFRWKVSAPNPFTTPDIISSYRDTITAYGLTVWGTKWSFRRKVKAAHAAWRFDGRQEFMGVKL